MEEGSTVEESVHPHIAPAWLIESFRQGTRSGIIANAHRIDAGRMPMLIAPEAGERSDPHSVDAADPEAAVRGGIKVVRDGCSSTLPSACRCRSGAPCALLRATQPLSFAIPQIKTPHPARIGSASLESYPLQARLTEIDTFLYIKAAF